MSSKLRGILQFREERFSFQLPFQFPSRDIEVDKNSGTLKRNPFILKQNSEYDSYSCTNVYLYV